MPFWARFSFACLLMGHPRASIEARKGSVLFNAQVRQMESDFTPCTSTGRTEYCGGDVAVVSVAHRVISFLWGVHNIIEFGAVLGILSFVRMASVGVEYGGVVAFGSLCVVDESIVGL